MLVNPYDVETLRRLWDRGVRRGERLTDLAPELSASFQERNRLRQEARAPGLTEQQRLARVTLHEESVRAAEKALTGFLNSVGASIDERMVGGGSPWVLQSGPIVNEKQTWQTDRRTKPEIYFEEKIAEHTLRAAFNLAVPARSRITEALKLVLSDSSPKVVYRTDIKACFESIPHDRLLASVRNNRRVPRTIVGQCESLLGAYSTAATTDKGLPRGVGISSTLAEIYLQDLDEQIQRAVNPLFSARFVDDLIIVVNPRYEDQISGSVRAIVKAAGLRLNPSKTQKVHYRRPKAITFLGYRYGWDKGDLMVRLSTQRYDRIERKLEAAFDAHRLSGSAAKDDLLIKRVRMLTSNYRLTNNKRNALAGVFFSNPLLDEPLPQLTTLDATKRRLLTASTVNRTTAGIIDRASFVDGFRLKRFAGFSPEEYRRVTAVWRGF